MDLQPTPENPCQASNSPSHKGMATTGILSAMIHAAAHGLLWLGLMGMMVVVVPRYVRIFDDFGVNLPPFSMLVISSSNLVKKNWYFFLLLGSTAAIVDGWLLWQLGRRDNRGRVWLISGLLLLCPVVVMVFVWWSMQLPMVDMAESLSLVSIN